MWKGEGAMWKYGWVQWRERKKGIIVVVEGRVPFCCLFLGARREVRLGKGREGRKWRLSLSLRVQAIFVPRTPYVCVSVWMDVCMFLRFYVYIEPLWLSVAEVGVEVGVCVCVCV